jgi:hypothetical protein
MTLTLPASTSGVTFCRSGRYDFHFTGVTGLLVYSAGLDCPPGVLAGTRSGFGLPVAPSFAPYGDPVPRTAIGAWPVVVLGSLVCGGPAVGCPERASGSGHAVGPPQAWKHIGEREFQRPLPYGA